MCRRQPPVDRRSAYLGAVMGDADNASEEKTEVAIKRRKTRCIPQEMLFDIFLRLPALILHDVMGHVCREWNLMIRSQNFIYHHLRNSSSGIIIQKTFSNRDWIYVEMRRGCLEVCKFPCMLGEQVLTSCNGLVLAFNFSDPNSLYVVNPLTKQRAVLPPYFHQIRNHANFRLAFVEASMEYKVVHAIDSGLLCVRTHIAVLTIGVDRVWRQIDVRHLSLTARVPLMFPPLVTGAYIHWIGTTFVLTLDVETEIIRQFPLPGLRNSSGRFLQMGSNLSVVCDSMEFFRDIWEMNPKTGEWTMLLSFDFKPLSSKLKDWYYKCMESIVPFGWLAAREVLLFSTSCKQRDCVAYNLKTREMQPFELDIMPESHHFQAHVNSLVWLEGGFGVD